MPKQDTKNINKKRPLFRTGFTLLETTVAITILLFGLMGTVTLAVLGIKGASQAKSNITASFLAEEGLEFMRSKRDEAIMHSVDWLTYISSCNDPNGCYVDVPNNNLVVCSSGGCPKLLINEANGLFNYNLGTISQFTRKIKVNIISAYEAEVESEVVWPGRFGADQSVKIKSRLFDWQL